MKKAALMLITFLGLTACSQGVTSMPDRTQTPCGNKPNCVSTQDQREEHHLEPFTLTESATLDAIEQAALQLSGLKQQRKMAIICALNAHLKSCASWMIRIKDRREYSDRAFRITRRVFRLWRQSETGRAITNRTF